MESSSQPHGRTIELTAGEAEKVRQHEGELS